MKTPNLYLLLPFLAVACFTYKAGAQNPDSSRNQSVTAIYEYNSFNQNTRFRWQMASLEYKSFLANTTFITRVNYADRRGNSGWQAELDAYPKLSKKIYSYISVGVTPQPTVFPKWRASSSIYINLSRGFELETGARYIYFSQPFWMFTSGLGKYIGNWFILGRGYLSLTDNLGKNHSFSLTGRYYLKNEKDYFWGQVGSGISPDENQGAQLQIASLQRHTIAAGIRSSINKKHQLIASVSYARNEYYKGIFGHQITGTAGYGIRF